MKLMKVIIIGALLGLIAIFTPATASAVPIAEILYTETDLGDGFWQYDYTVFNKSDPANDEGVNLYEVTFWFNSAIELMKVSVPDDWDSIYDNISAPGYLLTFSMVPEIPPIGADIAPGAFLSGFVFRFDEQVGDLAFNVLLANPSDSSNPLTDSGTTVPVPEPATILLLAAGIGGLGFAKRRRLMSL